MRRLLIACAFALTACATPQAHADEILANPEVLRSCVTAAGADRAALAQCEGLMARDCFEAEGLSTMSEVLCWDRETNAWEDLVNANTVRIEAADAEKGARLRSANEAWAVWLEAECEYRAYEFGGGSGEQVDRVRCAAALTTARAIDLIALR